MASRAAGARCRGSGPRVGVVPAPDPADPARCDRRLRRFYLRAGRGGGTPGRNPDRPARVQPRPRARGPDARAAGPARVPPAWDPAAGRRGGGHPAYRPAGAPRDRPDPPGRGARVPGAESQPEGPGHSRWESGGGGVERMGARPPPAPGRRGHPGVLRDRPGQGRTRGARAREQSRRAGAGSFYALLRPDGRAALGRGPGRIAGGCGHAGGADPLRDAGDPRALSARRQRPPAAQRGVLRAAGRRGRRGPGGGRRPPCRGPGRDLQRLAAPAVLRQPAADQLHASPATPAAASMAKLWSIRTCSTMLLAWALPMRPPPASRFAAASA